MTNAEKNALITEITVRCNDSDLIYHQAFYEDIKPELRKQEGRA